MQNIRAKLLYVFFFLIWILFVFEVPSGWTQQEKVRIAKIDIEGNITADKELIRLNSGLTVGSMVAGEDIQRALKQLYNLGIYSSISFWKVSESAAGMDLLIRVAEYPRIKQISIKGNKEVKLKDVEEKLSLYAGQVINPVSLEKSVERLKKHYIQKGYLLADIRPVLANTADSLSKNLTVEITEGSRVQVKKIRFHGNNSFGDKTLRKQMKDIKEDTWWRGADFKPEKYDKDKEKVLSYYRNNGFRNAQVLRDSLSYDKNKTDMFIDIFVDEGQRYYFGSTSFEGNKLYTPVKLKTGFEFNKGDVYSEEKFTKSIQNISKIYYDEGYIYAQVSPRETIVNGDTVNIHFTVEEGSPVRVNQIIIAGNTKTKEKVIRREIWLKPGEIFSNSALERSQRDVWILNYFSSVNPSLKVLPDNQNLVDVVFQVEEKSTDTANMSAGYSQLDGMIGSVGVAMNNFRGTGQIVNFDWQFGKIYRSLRLGFTEPWLFDSPTLAGVTVFDTKRGGPYYGFDYKNRGVSLRLGRRFRWPDDYFRGDWVVQVARNEISNVDQNLNLQAHLIGNRNSNSVSVTQTIARDSRNRPEFPTAGSVFSFSTTLSGGPLGGEEDFYRNEFQVEQYSPTFWKFVLYNNALFGVMKGLGPNSYIPPLEFFYMGGTALSIGTQLRGYEERLVGPVTTSGYPKGGLTELKYTTEMRFPIVPNPTTYGLIFAEAGNVWQTVGETNPFDLRRSMGVGFRVYMPLVGVLGLDVGYGFDNIDAYSGKKFGKWRAHFQFGKQF